MTCRTPPLNELEAYEKATTEVGKRIRTEDSPDAEDTRKRRCWEESCSERYQSSNFKEIDQTNATTDGISKGYENEEFVKELVRLNFDIELELNQSVADKIKVVTKRQCRNPTKENWVLQSSPEIAKWFLKNRTYQPGYLL
nr:unnamed protein product [Callosobruchus analis]